MGQEVGCRVALTWWIKGEQKSITLEQGRSYYLGRMSIEDLRTYKDSDPDPLRIYIYTPQGDAIVDTGFNSSITSRRHALITPKDCALDVLDHGSRGTGSKNGTYIGSRKLHGSRGEARPGDTIRLGATGPQFIVVGIYGDKRFITLDGGVPIDLPQPLARSIRSTSTVKLGEEAVVTPAPGRYKAEGVEVIVRDVNPETRNLLVLHRIQVHINRILTSVKERNFDDAYNNLMLILDKAEYREALTNAEEQSIVETYNELSMYVRGYVKSMKGTSVVMHDDVQRLLKRLDKYIEEYINSRALARA
ncbi:MAG: FHA domain-containing protein [Desulfurococcales archaeon]|nr:FHA domain-containing protein [Desulfurococcales archaeon]